MPFFLFLFLLALLTDRKQSVAGYQTKGDCPAEARRPPHEDGHWHTTERRHTKRRRRVLSVPPRLVVNAPLLSAMAHQEQPAAYLVWKQMKSLTLSTGGVVEPSQFAYGSPAAYLVWKQIKSDTFRMGGTLEPSQLG